MTDVAQGTDSTEDVEPQGTPADKGTNPEVAKLRSENAERRLAAADLQKQVDALTAQIAEGTDADLAEQKRFEELAEKRQVEVNDLKAQAVKRDAELREGAIQRAVYAASVKAGIADPEDAYRLADLAGVEVAEDGAITGVEESVTALAKAKPYLLGTSKPSAPDTEGGQGSAPESTGAVLTPGERAGVEQAAKYGYEGITEEALRARKKDQDQFRARRKPDQEIEQE